MGWFLSCPHTRAELSSSLAKAIRQVGAPGTRTEPCCGPCVGTAGRRAEAYQPRGSFPLDRTYRYPCPVRTAFEALSRGDPDPGPQISTTLTRAVLLITHLQKGRITPSGLEMSSRMKRATGTANPLRPWPRYRFPGPARSFRTARLSGSAAEMLLMRVCSLLSSRFH